MARVPLVVRVSILVIFALLIHKGVEAQVPDDGPSSVGFANPDNVQPVRAYRLPTWHWSTWTLQANGDASRSRVRGDDDESDWFNADLGLNPMYRSFWENEDQQAFLQLAPSLSLDRIERTDSNGGSEQERNQSTIRTGMGVVGNLRAYVADRAFLFAATDGLLEYSHRRTEDEGMEETGSDVQIRTNVRLGVGLGRVRVVTPVIRALRMRERLRTVAPGTSVSDKQVQVAARQLARRPGYQAVYDRSDKYFWRDFFDRVGLSGRSPFETFYVADILREPVGVRREGSELVVGPLGTYRRDLEREEENDRLENRTFSEEGEIGGFARGRWYRNVTLHHQLGADVEANYRHFVESQGLLDHEIGLDAEGQWLWVLADRLRLDTRVRANLEYQRLEEQRVLPWDEDYRSSNEFILSSDLQVFVENSLSLNVGAHVRYGYDDYALGSASRFDTGLQFRINYVLSRALR